MKKNIFLIVFLLILVGVGYYFYSSKSQGVFSENIITDFAIEDTSQVYHIVITNSIDGSKVDLKRNEGSPIWTLNDTLLAKEHSVRILLKTFKTIYVLGPINKAAKENVISNIAGTNVAVQIYDKEDKIIKTYYIGSCAPGQKGTYMVLENADGERSSDPVITTQTGYIGCLRQRFFTNEKEWVYTGIFEFPGLNFSKVSFKNNVAPEESFSINYSGGNNITIIDEFNRKELQGFNLSTVKDYLLLYKKVHFETLESHQPKYFEDSLINALPMYTITVTNNENVSHHIDIHPKAAPSTKPEWPIDKERMYGVMDEDEVGLIQIYHFDPLFKKLSDFK